MPLFVIVTKIGNNYKVISRLIYELKEPEPKEPEPKEPEPKEPEPEVKLKKPRKVKAKKVALVIENED